jgi:hypothetical protein
MTALAKCFINVNASFTPSDFTAAMGIAVRRAFCFVCLIQASAFARSPYWTQSPQISKANTRVRRRRASVASVNNFRIILALNWMTAIAGAKARSAALHCVKHYKIFLADP